MNHTQYKDTQGRYLTQGLFYEYVGKGAPFTLKPYDHDGSVSMKTLYLSYEDPTEYLFATEVLGSWEHWQKLIGSQWFSKQVEEWRDELAVLLRAKGIQELMKQSSKSAVAATWLAERKWDKNAVGRPTKQQRAKTTKEEDEAMRIAQEEADRIGLH